MSTHIRVYNCNPQVIPPLPKAKIPFLNYFPHLKKKKLKSNHNTLIVCGNYDRHIEYSIYGNRNYNNDITL